MSLLKSIKKRYWFLLLILAGIAYSFTWTNTPHGRIDYRAAVSLHLLSFEMKEFQPDPNVDFRFDLPVNLIYALSGLLPAAEVSETRDIRIPSPEGAVPARVYWPKGYTADKGPLPLFIYLHGGGFVVGSVDIFDPLTRELANTTNSIVISVDYRLAPAHPYPAALNDGYAALEWAAKHASELNGDSNRIYIGGDSAGGNLSAAIALKSKMEEGPRLSGQILYYPVVDLTDKSYPSREKFADGYGLSSKAGAAFHLAYSGHIDDRSSPYISPLCPDLSGLPPALILTAAFDPLTDGTRAYVERLQQAGVPVTYHNFDQTIHGFMSIRLFSEQQQALEKTQAFVRTLFP